MCRFVVLLPYYLVMRVLFYGILKLGKGVAEALSTMIHEAIVHGITTILPKFVETVGSSSKVGVMVSSFWILLQLLHHQQTV
ncbi:uncharacterized protein DS421_19g653230 [Arachis hypogaea]|uniref:Uncharacterized protein n=1 Tax=Arachis hypogaea TaxID=3818 RepID=A0A6B9V7T8_ARAHY|nr:uncharacterized protein DS421_19g653230 [Arachis hypogaea]